MTFLFPMRPSTPRVLPESPAEFLVQEKVDGWNVVVNGGRVWTRHGHDITSWCSNWRFDLNPPWPVNGELVAVGGQRKDVPSIKSGKFEPRLHAFDVMLEGVPLEERLEMVDEWAEGDAWPILTWDPLEEGGGWGWVNLVLEIVKANGLEGLVLKRKGSPYHVSQEISVVSPDWLRMLVPAQVTR